MPLAHFKVGGIVRRRHFHNTRSERWIDHVVLDERDFTIHQGQNRRFTFVLCVPFIIRVNGNGCVAEHRFGPCGGDFDECVIAAFQRILDVIQLRIDRLVDDLQIRQCGHAARAPVDEPLAAVDQSFLVQTDKDFADSAR